VCLICASWYGALGFFALSYLVVAGAGRVPDRLRPWANALGVAVLVGALLVLRASPSLDLLGLTALGSRAQTLGLQFVGLSYCFLRAVYALLDPRRWTAGDYARYYFFAPTFISGPVSRPEDHDAAQAPSADDVREGCARIGYGVVLVLLAQCLRLVVPLGSAEQLFWALDLGREQPSVLWLGVALSGLWLYLDFSGFSDVFIGLARLTGVRAPENFAGPYAATDITAFWQRWHLSLAEWLRGVVYTPLSKAGLRLLPPAAVASLSPLVTMAVCGLWHRASLTYLLWGGLHGLALAGHALWQRLLPDLVWRRAAAYRVTAWGATHLLVACSWALFLPVDDTIPLAARLDLLRCLAGLP
jgi:alginate O-acetyltransferase complex protein AlgI